jgi:serine/threonine-protein kinase
VDAFERLWHSVKDHKLIQWALAYVAAALAIAHGQELVAHAYEWPEIVGRALIGVLGLGFPIALTLAWYHRHKGFKRFGAGEMTIISLLMLIGAGLLMVLVRGPSEHPPGREAAIPNNSRGIADARSSSSPSQAAKPRIAVMPFENLSPDPANAFFTDGMQEEILTALSNNAPGLEVFLRVSKILNT